MEKILSAISYGISLFSVDVLKTFLKKEKVRTKKVLHHFQNNHARYLNSLNEGIWLPFLPIDAEDYVIKIESEGDFFDDEWQKKMEYESFNLQTDGSFWITGLGILLDLRKREFDKDVIASQTLDGIPLNYGFRYELTNGKYLVKIAGYSRILKKDYPNSNFGFLFTFSEINEFAGFKDPREDEQYNFNIANIK